METKFIEAVENSKFNWGKFMVGRFTPDEWAKSSELDQRRLLQGRGWSPDHVLVLDLQTGEGAILKPGGLAQSDLNDKHQIWVCPMFQPFLEWLYRQDLTDLAKLPGLVNLGDVPIAMQGYRRTRRAADDEDNPILTK